MLNVLKMLINKMYVAKIIFEQIKFFRLSQDDIILSLQKCTLQMINRGLFSYLDNIHNPDWANKQKSNQYYNIVQKRDQV